MSALRRDEIWRPSNSKDINNARRRGRGRLTFLQASRATNIAAIVRPQAPVPENAIIPPPTAASQVSQWARYVPNVRREPRSLDSARNIDQPPSEAHLPTIHELPATGSSVRYELPVSESVVQLPENRHLRDSESAVLGSPVSPLSNVSTNISWHAPSSIESSSATRRRSIAPTPADRRSVVHQQGSIELLQQLQEGFDCPLRAGPDGGQKCGWKPPRHDVPGFPTMARVKEHIGAHGLFCPDCDKVYTVPTRYKDHRKNKAETGFCSALGAERTKFPYLITLPPDLILSFFKRPDKKISDQEAWYDGYKTLNPGWEKRGSLPFPFYRLNVKQENGFDSQDVSRSSQDPLEGSSNSAAAQLYSQLAPKATSNSANDEESHQSDRATHNVAFDHQAPAMHSIPGTELEPTQSMDGLVWDSTFANGLFDFDQFPSNFEMSGALPAEQELESIGPEVNHPRPDFPPQEGSESSTNDASMTHPHNAGFSELPNHYPYTIAADGQHDPADSAMELCKPRSGSGNGGEEASTASSMQSSHARGKRASRVSNQNPVARKKVLLRIEKLTDEVVQLYSKIQTLNKENQSLNSKVNEVESEKQKLVVTLMQIRQEVFKWEIDDDEALDLNERIDTLNESMQNIRQLLPD